VINLVRPLAFEHPADGERITEIDALEFDAGGRRQSGLFEIAYHTDHAVSPAEQPPSRLPSWPPAPVMSAVLSGIRNARYVSVTGNGRIG
jgi:hypothetical protein